MNMIERAIERLNGRNLSFGLREALILAAAGVAIASAAALHYAA
jgi:hypothetical protein